MYYDSVSDRFNFNYRCGLQVDLQTNTKTYFKQRSPLFQILKLKNLPGSISSPVCMSEQFPQSLEQDISNAVLYRRQSLTW